MHLHIDHSQAINVQAIHEYAKKLTNYVSSLETVRTDPTYTHAEAALYLPTDQVLQSRVETSVDQFLHTQLKYIFVVGIGGSNLGTKAIYDALFGLTDLAPHDHLAVYWVDTVNTAALQVYLNQVIARIQDKREYVLVSISKSGGTTETMANTEILLHALAQRFGDVRDRTIIVSDENSPYWHAAQQEHILHLAIPHAVGGRYSVFSAVGLLPLGLMGIDTRALIQGARDILVHCLNPDVTHNPAALSASVLAHSYTAGIKIHDLFVFHSELESLGKWYRQLMGESIGKEHSADGTSAHVGITPTVSVGSTDLHSVGQLYLGGPHDKLTTFVYNTDSQETCTVPTARMFPQITPMIDGKSTTQILHAILEGTKTAYNTHQLPFMEITLNGITPYELGAFMQYKMIEMMYLGRLLNVNPFDQPNVESYKIETKRLLEAA